MLTAINEINAVEIFIAKDGSWKFSQVNLLKAKGEISVSKASGMLTVEDFKGVMNSKLPTVLLINGKGILNKNLSKFYNDDAKTLNAVLPNANTDEFLLQIDRTSSSGMVSVIRRALLEEIVAFFRKNKIKILELYIGLGVTSVLHQVLEKEAISKMGYDLEFKQDGDMAFVSNESFANMSYKLGDEEHSSDGLGPLAVGFNYWLGLRDFSSLNHEYVLYSRKESSSKKLLHVTGAVVLGVLFLGLLANLMLFQNYSKKAANLGAVAAVNEDVLNEMNRLNEEIEVKKELIASVGAGQQSKYYAHYADQIANTVPNEISLVKLLIKPLEKKIKAKSRIGFVERDISIEGISNSSGDLNGWMSDMRNLEFIEKVELISYLREGKNKGMFEVKVEIL